jgi:predicted  nucleic acid-binding Zn-ribbon protein
LGGEALDAQLVLANAAVDDAAATLDRERARASEAIARDRAELAELEIKRLALRTQIAQTDAGETSLAMYDRIAHSKGTAIAEALNQQCTACQMMLRPQRWIDLRDNSANSESAHTIMTCENCGHMLYYDPARDSPQRKTVQSESIAAQIVRSSI